MADTLEQLHAEVDRAAALVADRNKARMVCARGCFGCCIDDLTIFEVEADRIRSGAATLLATATPHPEGACAFLGAEGECRVYEFRPYVCRTQGLPLRWIDDEAEAEYRDVCMLNDDELEPLETLPVERFWSIGETEARLSELQDERSGDQRRVRLRDLFRR